MDMWVEEIEGWETRPFSGGYAGLRTLADDGFSGAVMKSGTWLFMINGRAVDVVQYRQTPEGGEVRDGDIKQFEDGASRADGTVYVAPHPVVPLLIAMKIGEKETRGKYYTEKTPLNEVSATLEDGNFTGYVELSKNVLSGDHYAVYQSGRSMNVAFIGNARRVITEKDARDRMHDEVGIYEVTAAEIDVIDIPKPADDAGADAIGGATAAGTTTASNVSESDDPSTSPNRDQPDVSAGADDPAATDAASTQPKPDTTPTDEEPVSTADAESTTTAAATAETDSTEESPTESASDRSDARPSATDEQTENGSSPDGELGRHESAEGQEPSTNHELSAEREPPADREPSPNEASESNTDAGVGGESSSPTDRLATRAVPSLDQERTETADGERSAAENTQSLRQADSPPRDSEPNPQREPDQEPMPTTTSDELDELRAELRETNEELAATKKERDDLASKVEALQARIQELEAEEATNQSGPSLSTGEAYEGTNLFVRYESKGKLTLADAHDGEGDPETLASNLRLEYHTRFDESATIDGRPFPKWLTTTQRYQFIKWLSTTLPFEIRNTGSAEQLAGLYDALPDLDRIELNGTVSVTDEDDEQELEFGLVGRDRMGEPLIVANLESGRAPVSEAAMGNLVSQASAVAESHDALVGAFYVTSAFYEPEALEVTREATGGSLLSRDKRRSFVKLSRKRGYHLGLVESRADSFNLSVPDL